MTGVQNCVKAFHFFCEITQNELKTKRDAISNTGKESFHHYLSSCIQMKIIH